MRYAAVVFALYCGGAGSTEERQARPGEDPVLSRFVGSWQGEGKHLGVPMRATLQYAWVLGKHFLRGEGKTEMGAGAFSYESVIYFRTTGKEGQYSVVWLDNMGNIITSTLFARDKTLSMEWMEKTPQGEHPARSEITITEKGWFDRSLGKKGDTWIEFGSMTYTRK